MRLSVVCYLDRESTNIIRGVQGELSKLTGAKASLKLWQPHITVGDGVDVSGDELRALQTRLNGLAAKTLSFEVELSDILKIDFRKGGEGEESTPYGLYLDVKPNDRLLKLVTDISEASVDLDKWYLMPSPYHPHCALAFKDLSKEGFEFGIQYLDSIDLKLQTSISHVSIVEMLPNQTRELACFNFG